jgi:hypothetical protein
MIDPLNVVVTQSVDRVRQTLDVLQLIATLLLGVVAVAQARAATRQAQSAQAQAIAAETQAKAARAALEQAIKPKLVPSEWTPNDRGGTLRLQNLGQGTAHAIRWRFDREWSWVDGEDLVSNGDLTSLEIVHHNLNRRIVIAYHSKEGDEFTTSVFPTTLEFQYSEPGSAAIVPSLRIEQRRH